MYLNLIKTFLSPQLIRFIFVELCLIYALPTVMKIFTRINALFCAFAFFVFLQTVVVCRCGSGNKN